MRARRVLLAASIALLLMASPAMAQTAPARPSLESAQQAAEQGDLLRAESLVRAVLAQQPGDAPAQFLLARVLTWQGRYIEASAAYAPLLAVEPDNADYLLGAAKASLGSGRQEEALALLDRARTVAPTYEEVWRTQLATLDAGGPEYAGQAAGLRAEARLHFPAAAWINRARADNERPTVEVAAGYSLLTNGFAPWSQQSVVVTRPFAERSVAVATYASTQRFDLRDHDLRVALFQPFTEHLFTNVEVGYSPTHQVLPHYSLDGGMYYALPQGYGVGLNVRRTAYTVAENTRETLTLERYWRKFRFAYGLSATQLPAAPVAIGHALTAGFYFTETTVETLTLNMGQEMEFAAPDRLLVMDVRGAVLRGRTDLSPRWAITHQVDWIEQGSVFSRRGVQLGVRYAF